MGLGNDVYNAVWSRYSIPDESSGTDLKSNLHSTGRCDRCRKSILRNGKENKNNNNKKTYFMLFMSKRFKI